MRNWRELLKCYQSLKSTSKKREKSTFNLVWKHYNLCYEITNETRTSAVIASMPHCTGSSHHERTWGCTGHSMVAKAPERVSPLVEAQLHQLIPRGFCRLRRVALTVMRRSLTVSRTLFGIDKNTWRPEWPGERRWEDFFRELRTLLKDLRGCERHTNTISFTVLSLPQLLRSVIVCSAGFPGFCCIPQSKGWE